MWGKRYTYKIDVKNMLNLWKDLFNIFFIDFRSNGIRILKVKQDSFLVWRDSLGFAKLFFKFFFAQIVPHAWILQESSGSKILLFIVEMLKWNQIGIDSFS